MRGKSPPTWRIWGSLLTVVISSQAVSTYNLPTTSSFIFSSHILNRGKFVCPTSTFVPPFSHSEHTPKSAALCLLANKNGEFCEADQKTECNGLDYSNPKESKQSLEEYKRKGSSRRSMLSQSMRACGVTLSALLFGNTNNENDHERFPQVFRPQAVFADVAPPVEMKTFEDPMGLFSLRIPKRFYALRRSSKGDLPNSKTGDGRRGSSIFTAGDMAKAEVIAVERFPTATLLEEAGIDASGDLSTFPALGQPKAIADLLCQRRERDRQQQTARTSVLPESVQLSNDGQTLQFELRTSVEVQKPELLMEQMGVSELIRVTLAKATLLSRDGQMLVVYASALRGDEFYDGVDGVALRDAVDSFQVSDQSTSVV